MAKTKTVEHDPLAKFAPTPIKPGKRYALTLGTFGSGDYIEIVASQDGQSITIRSGAEGGIAVFPEAGNMIRVRRVLYNGDARTDPHRAC